MTSCTVSFLLLVVALLWASAKSPWSCEDDTFCHLRPSLSTAQARKRLRQPRGLVALDPQTGQSTDDGEKFSQQDEWRLPRRMLGLLSGGLLAAYARRQPASALQQVVEVVRRPSPSSIVDRLRPDARLVVPRNAEAQANAEKAVLYPSWLFGEWQVTSKPDTFAEPLGSRFVDPDTHKAVKEDFDSKKQVRWRSRYYWASLDERGQTMPRNRLEKASELYGLAVAGPPPQEEMPVLPGPVVQFRSFNAAQEVQAFLGESGSGNIISDADPRVHPLQVMVAFPVEGDENSVRTVKLRMEGASTELGRDSFVSSELFRQVISTDGEVDSVGDYEIINEYKLLSGDGSRAAVRSRTVKYLVPGDELYEESKGRAVSWLDYDWDIERVKDCIDTPYGRQCLFAA
eukprot:TRINITY_DN16044_c0_g1_i2.p1 TRINITY_DN16044_c0_g1~~TRINITY_DN16044_c0_g1_i2.p1  ORF type:complete len:401 (-),score=68.54 TRINITY_DN16044_c0_g1_i2:351-1553(-)